MLKIYEKEIKIENFINLHAYQDEIKMQKSKAPQSLEISVVKSLKAAEYIYSRPQNRYSYDRCKLWPHVRANDSIREKSLWKSEEIAEERDFNTEFSETFYIY